MLVFCGLSFFLTISPLVIYRNGGRDDLRFTCNIIMRDNLNNREIIKLLCIHVTELQAAIKNDFLSLLYEIEKYL